MKKNDIFNIIMALLNYNFKDIKFDNSIGTVKNILKTIGNCRKNIKSCNYSDIIIKNIFIEFENFLYKTDSINKKILDISKIVEIIKEKIIKLGICEDNEDDINASKIDCLDSDIIKLFDQLLEEINKILSDDIFIDYTDYNKYINKIIALSTTIITIYHNPIDYEAVDINELLYDFYLEFLRIKPIIKVY